MIVNGAPMRSPSERANERSTTTPSGCDGSSQRPSATTGCATAGWVAGIARSEAGSFLPFCATVTGAERYGPAVCVTPSMAPSATWGLSLV